MAKNDAILKAKGNQDRLDFDREKHATDLSLKKLEVTSKLGGGSQGAMGDIMIHKGQEKPKGLWDGVVNGILAVMGGHAKGRANEEMLAKIEDALSVYSANKEVAGQAQEILGNVKKQEAEWKASPSSQQFTGAIQDGSFEGTMKVAMKQMGIPDGSFSLSSDLSEVFIKDENGKVVDSQPITNFLSPEDSPQFKTYNDLYKAQRIASDNKEIKALAEENQRMKIARMYQKEFGMSPELASQMAENDIKEELTEEQKLKNETKKADASEMRANNDTQRLTLEKDMKPLQAEKLRNEVALQEVEKKMGFSKGTLNYIKEQRDDLIGVDQEYQQYQELKDLLHKKDKNGKLVKDEDALAGWFGIERPDWMKNPKQARMAQIKSDLTGSHFKKMGYRNKQEYEKIFVPNSKLGWDENMKIINDNMRILKPMVDEKKSYDATLKKAMSHILVKPEEPATAAGLVEGQGADGKGSGAKSTITLHYEKDGKSITKTVPTTDYDKSKALAKQQGFGVVE